uniref:SXP/RAL-2 family protein Ani s 5-like cation-binding domain-containing protein n=1 Tax=Strongyloides venezuelensis TaxID=75913 RepID=A0A0K0F1L3_STRVS
MHFIKYFAIFVLLAVQYSFQDTSVSSENSVSSSEEKRVDVGTSKEIPSTNVMPSVGAENARLSFYSKLKNGIKKQNQKTKNFFKTNINKENMKNKLTKLKDKIDTFGTTIKVKFANLKDKTSRKLNNFFKKNKSDKSSLSENDTRVKRSFIKKVAKATKNAIVEGAKKGSVLFKKLF